MNFLIDIFLGFLIFSAWLNIKNDNFFQLFNQFTEQTRNCIIYLFIICSPLIFDTLLNLNHLFSTEQKSGFTASTFLISSTSAILTIVIREYIVSLKEIVEMKDAIFWELYYNHKSLSSLTEDHKKSNKSGFKDDALDLILWVGRIEEKWSKKSYETHISKIKSKNIYSSDIMDEIQRIYQDFNDIIKQSKNNKSYLRKCTPVVLKSIQNILKQLDPQKYHQLSID